MITSMVTNVIITHVIYDFFVQIVTRRLRRFVQKTLVKKRLNVKFVEEFVVEF